MPAPKLLTQFLPPEPPLPFAEANAAADARMETANVARLTAAGNLKAARAALDSAYAAEASRAVIRELKDAVEDREDALKVADSAIKNARADLVALREKQQDALAQRHYESGLDLFIEASRAVAHALDLVARCHRHKQAESGLVSAKVPRLPQPPIIGWLCYGGTVHDRFKPIGAVSNFIRAGERLAAERAKSGKAA